MWDEAMKRPLRQLLIRVLILASVLPVVMEYSDEWLNRVFGYPLDHIVMTIGVLVVVLMACAPPIRNWLAHLRHNRQLRRQRQGQSPNCSYDLRAHKPGERCPECGTPIPPSNARNQAGHF
jgi:hypothetical protein